MELHDRMLDLLVENKQEDKGCEEEATAASEIQEKIGLCLRLIEKCSKLVMK